MYGTAGVSLSKDGPYQRVAVNIGNPPPFYLWLSLSQGLAICYPFIVSGGISFRAWNDGVIITLETDSGRMDQTAVPMTN